MRALVRFWPDIRDRIGVYGLVMVLTLVANGIAMGVPVITGNIVDGPIAAGDFAGLLAPAGLVLLIGLVEVAAIWARRTLIAPVVSQWEVTWRARIYDRLQYIAVAEHDSWESGQLLSRAVNDLSQLRRFFAFGLPFLVITPIVFLTGIGILVSLHPAFGLVMFVMGVATSALVAIFERKYRLASRQSQDTMGELTTEVEESVQGIRVLKAFGRGGWAVDRFTGVSTRLKDIELRKARLDSWLWSAVLALPALALVTIVGIGTWGVAEGWMTLGTVIAAVTIAMFLQMPIEMFGFLLTDALMSITAATRYWEVMDLDYDIADPAGGIDVDPPRREYSGRLDFCAVDFRFADADQDVLHDLNLHIAAGQTVALVGATGSGKTALASLVPRLQDTTGGSIRIDGTDVRALPVNELRRIVSVSFEDPILFSASVRDNVTLGHPEASEDEVWAALTIAQAADFVNRLPAGLDTAVGEQGLSLSGGQRQRLALARAVIGRPRILVLDDPLSAVDVDTEDRVQRALRQVLGHSTTLIIAHRPSTTALADSVAVLDGGRIAAYGTHEELLASSPLYRDLMGAEAAAGSGQDVRSASTTGGDRA